MTDEEQQPSRRRADLDLEARRILRELAEDGVLYRLGWDGLLRRLLREYHDSHTSTATPEELRVAAARALGLELETLPLDVGELALEVINNHLHIDKLPRDEFVNVQQEVADDLRKIRSNIEVCEEALKELATRKAAGEEQDGDNYRSAYRDYKIAQNVQARDELLHFLEAGVVDEVLHRASRTFHRRFLPASFFWFHAPYPFRFAPDIYSPESLSQVRNKFRNEPVSAVREWERLFEEEPERFHADVGGYIQNHKLVDAIRARLRTHHRLVLRAEILEQALDVYEVGKLALFCTVMPVQIEGLVGDWARELGVPDNELRRATLPLKVDGIKKNETVFRDFEYFRFWFPALRNRVAHGAYETANVAQVANLLLLDLADLCDRLHDDLLPTNKYVALLRGVDAAKPNYESAFEYVRFRDVEPPAFYGLEPNRANADALLSSEGFWSWLEDSVDSREPDFLVEARDAAIALKKASLDGGRAHRLLRKIAATSS